MDHPSALFFKNVVAKNSSAIEQGESTIVDGIRRRLGISISPLLPVELRTIDYLAPVHVRSNRLRWDDGSITGLLIFQGDSKASGT